MTRKKKVIVIIALALVAVLMLGAVVFTIYRNVQIERLRVYIVDSLLEKSGRSYSLSDRKELYDAIEVKTVFWHDIDSEVKHWMEDDYTFQRVTEDEEYRGYFSSYVYRPLYTAILYSADVEQYNGFGMKEGFYECMIECRDDKWSVLHFDGPYINVSECTPTEFVRRIL